jgi:hypothetical protein
VSRKRDEEEGEGNVWVGEDEVKRRIGGWVEGEMGDKRSVVQLNRCRTHKGRTQRLEFTAQRMCFYLFTALTPHCTKATVNATLSVYCITLVGCNAAATLVTGRKEQTTEPDCISRSELN